MILAEMGLVSEPSDDERQDVEVQSAAAHEPLEEKSRGFNTIMKQGTMHLMAFFVFIYVGVEVTIGGEYHFDYDP